MMEDCISMEISSIPEICTNFGSKIECSEIDFSPFLKTADSIEALLFHLKSDDNCHQFRRSLGNYLIKNKFFACLLMPKDGKIVSVSFQLLAELTSPIECIVGSEEGLGGEALLYELESLLYNFKKELADYELIKAIMSSLTQITNQNTGLNETDSLSVSHGLFLLRNLLHISHPESQLQKTLLWNLFAHSFDSLLLNLITSTEGGRWGNILVQLLALIYKEQHIGTLQKLLRQWLENSMSESSEDNESNTSPKEQGEFNDSSSPTLTSSDPTNSDSSENGDKVKKSAPTHHNTHHQVVAKEQHVQAKCYSKVKGKNGKIKGKGKQSDADSGIVSLLSQEKLSNSDEKNLSGDEPNNASINNSNTPNGDERVKMVVLIKRSTCKTTKVNTKHVRAQSHIASTFPTLTSLDKHELKRRKLHKKLEKGMNHMKCHVHHNPTEEDISLLMRGFTVDFLLRGYSPLVSLLLHQLSVSPPPHSLEETNVPYLDKSHFFWLLTYFLKFTSQLELELETMSSLLSLELLTYLTYEGMALSESLLVGSDECKPELRRIHLLVTALREFIQSVEIFSRMPSYSESDKVHLNQLQFDMVKVEDFRNLFLFLIRQYRPDIQSKQYLQDLITTNHVLLLLLEKTSKQNDSSMYFDIRKSIQDFSSPAVVCQYAYLLENFESNGEFVNDCIFTMMHHIAGDLASPHLLCHPLILKTFSHIWELEFEIKDDWADLIEFVIQSFMRRKTKKLTLVSDLQHIGTKTSESIHSAQNCWSKGKSVSSNIDQDESFPSKNNHCIDESEKSGEFSSFETLGELLSMDISASELVEKLLYEKEDLGWVQKQVLEACSVKIMEEGSGSLEEKGKIRRIVYEPIPYHYSKLKKSIPIIPWTKIQEISLMSPPYMLLLHKLGFHLPSDVGKVFPRIPHFWTSDILFSISRKLGPLPNDEFLKFDPLQIQEVDTEALFLPHDLYSPPPFSFHGENNVELNLSLPVRNNFLESHAVYGYGHTAHSVNWINLVHKSMQFFERHSEKAKDLEDEQMMDDCSSHKALPPPTVISEDVSMLSSNESDSELEPMNLPIL